LEHVAASTVLQKLELFVQLFLRQAFLLPLQQRLRPNKIL
jgi:hypothetical protein